MSVKVPEVCGGCSEAIMPEERVVVIDTYGDLMVRFWRYACDCGRVWANEAQRVHNHKEIDRAFKMREFEIKGMTG